MTTPARWWHGSGRIHDTHLRPPIVTGTPSTLTIARTIDDIDQSLVEATLSDDHVYLVNDRGAATMYAALHPNPWVYEVALDGAPFDDDPDFIDLADGMKSIRVAGAVRIIRREKPSKADVAEARYAITSIDRERWRDELNARTHPT